MPAALLAFSLSLFIAAPALAQLDDPALSSSEELRYGSDLSQVPREPYRTEQRLEGYQARPYLPPEPEVSLRPGAGSSRRGGSVTSSSSPVNTNPGGLRSPEAKARDRYQERAFRRNEQRKITQRSQVAVPQPPFTPGSPASLGQPGAARPGARP